VLDVQQLASFSIKFKSFTCFLADNHCSLISVSCRQVAVELSARQVATMARRVDIVLNRASRQMLLSKALRTRNSTTQTSTIWTFQTLSSSKHELCRPSYQSSIEAAQFSFHSTPTVLTDVRTFESENPELVTNNDHEKVLFEDFEPGEEIPVVPLPPFDDGSGKVIASPELKDLADRILQLSLLEIHQLTQLFNDHFDLDDGADMMMSMGGGVAAGAGAAEAAPVEEKTIFELKLTAFDEKSKIKIIKEIRAITGLGLKEAKELVEGAPKVVKKDIKKEEAEELKAKLEAVGATVEVV